MILICTDILQSNYLELAVPTGLPLNLRDATVRGVDWQPAANQLLYLPSVESQTAGTACSNGKTWERTMVVTSSQGKHYVVCSAVLSSWLLGTGKYASVWSLLSPSYKLCMGADVLGQLG